MKGRKLTLKDLIASCGVLTEGFNKQVSNEKN